MNQHCEHGWELIGEGGLKQLFLAQEIALNHHERWDGSGYPNGKRGEAISLAARIMNICDIYDALRSVRPYKPAFSHQRAVDIITVGDGRTHPGHFDPAVLAAFTANHALFEQIYASLTP